jgi:hypothetical protein
VSAAFIRGRSASPPPPPVPVVVRQRSSRISCPSAAALGGSEPTRKAHSSSGSIRNPGPAEHLPWHGPAARSDRLVAFVRAAGLRRETAPGKRAHGPAVRAQRGGSSACALRDITRKKDTSVFPSSFSPACPCFDSTHASCCAELQHLISWSSLWSSSDPSLTSASPVFLPLSLITGRPLPAGSSGGRLRGRNRRKARRRSAALLLSPGIRRGRGLHR